MNPLPLLPKINTLAGNTLATTPPAKAFDVFLDRAFCDLDAQLEQLAADALGTPGFVMWSST